MRILFILCSLLMIACSNRLDKKTIAIADYIIEVPNDFTLVKEKGIDSYVGKIVGDSIILSFDYGYYSNKLGHTIEDYIEDKSWCMGVINAINFKHEQNFILNTSDFKVKKVYPSTIKDSAICKSCDYIGVVEYKNKVYSLPINIPTSIKSVQYEIDTLDHHYRKIVWQTKGENYLTGIYLKDLNAFNKSINAHTSIAISGTVKDEKQLKKAIEIFKTLRKK